MGGCCCTTRRTQPNILPTYYYFPRVPEEQVPLSTRHAGASAVSAGFLVNPHLEASNLDVNQPPPVPDPYVVDSGRTPAESGTRETNNNAVQLTTGNHVTNPNAASSVGGENAVVSPGSLDKDLKEVDGKDPDFELTASIDIETDELKKSSKLFEYLVEECPTCLEEYDEENPKILTKCGHDFHLPCILEWMERSDACPVCDKKMGIDEVIINM